MSLEGSLAAIGLVLVAVGVVVSVRRATLVSNAADAARNVVGPQADAAIASNSRANQSRFSIVGTALLLAGAVPLVAAAAIVAVNWTLFSWYL